MLPDQTPVIDLLSFNPCWQIYGFVGDPEAPFFQPKPLKVVLQMLEKDLELADNAVKTQIASGYQDRGHNAVALIRSWTHPYRPERCLYVCRQCGKPSSVAKLGDRCHDCCLEGL